MRERLVYGYINSRQYPSGFVANDNNAENANCYDDVCVHNLIRYSEGMN
ncbi:hypothetical protein ACLI1A_06620 [Flavobacterium sp. RHBU_3]